MKLWKRIKILWYISGLDIPLPERRTFVQKLINNQKATVVDLADPLDRIKL